MSKANLILIKLDISQFIFNVLLNPIHWVSSISMRTDGQTDMMKLTVAYLNFANAPEN
jgi:hypothetical protein